MSIEHRNNPDSEECQQMAKDNELSVKVAQHMHKMSQGWTGNKCGACEGHGVITDSRGEEVSCSACAGTGNEYGDIIL